MSIPKPTIENLRLAWKRSQLDHPDKLFVTHPHIADWLSSDLDSWLLQISDKLEQGYSANPSAPCLAPKPGFLIRPGSVLDVEDELVFTYLVGCLFPAIHTKLSPYQKKPDIAHILSTDPNSENWIRSDWRVWANWRESSVSLADSFAFVLTTDIVGYYDNIELAILASDLRSVCGNDPHIQLLMDCLNRWSQPRGRGIPQGYAASHVLAKLYLHSLDTLLTDSGLTHLRYVDDVRVFCGSRLEAQQTIILMG